MNFSTRLGLKMGVEKSGVEMSFNQIKYLLFSLMITLDFNCIPRDPFFKSGGTDPDVSRIKLLIKGGIISEGIFNFVLSVQTRSGN